MFSKKFWRDAAERALSTAAQSALLVLGADQMFNAINAEWETVAGFAAGGAALSLLKAIAAAKVGDKDSASLDPELRTTLVP